MLSVHSIRSIIYAPANTSLVERLCKWHFNVSLLPFLVFLFFFFLLYCIWVFLRLLYGVQRGGGCHCLLLSHAGFSATLTMVLGWLMMALVPSLCGPVSNLPSPSVLLGVVAFKLFCMTSENLVVVLSIIDVLFPWYP